jgi:beta-glucosidase
VQAFRANKHANKGQIGLVVNLEPKYPASDSEADVQATARADAYMNQQYLDPAILGRYPAELADVFGDAWPEWPDEDMQLIREKLDFIGINFYARGVTAADESSIPVRASKVFQPEHTYTQMGWEVFPDALRHVLVWVKDRYGDIPVYITENGSAFYDAPAPIDGVVEDPLRVDYLRTHLAAVRQAIAEGAPVKGYFAWSLFDNFEWSAGYSKRFGIVHVNYATQERTIKSSGRLYSEIIRTNGAVLAK